ncbi:Uma2 family endonuclease [Nocardia nova]|uniref:Uma2 family endonuclease n=1 Tax=Nocardia nova TaxID=37330 RepID=A0A2S5ZW00_9NOCA|nr:Uma2 family endonuclease [Nocardia nova]PPJ21683.1 Uma2 family endonuclease [Nocardia nova]
MHWPDRLLTMADWEALPEDNSRSYELVEGVLIVSPRPVSKHQRAMWRLAAQLEPQLPPTLGVLTETEVVIDPVAPPTVRVPDLIVVPDAGIETNPRWNADEVLLAVEILSPGSRRTDRVAKFAEYAEAGIEHYWLVDLDAPTTLTGYRLVGDYYELIADNQSTVRIDLSGTPVKIDLTALTGSRSE